MIFVNVTTLDGTLVPVATTAIESCWAADSSPPHCLLVLTSGRQLHLSPDYGPDPAVITSRIAASVRQLEQRNQRRELLGDLSGLR